MIRYLWLLIVVVILAVAPQGWAIEAKKWSDAIQTLADYEQGDSKGVDLKWVEDQLGEVSGDSHLREWAEIVVIKGLVDAKTDEARKFMCRLLFTIGTNKCIPQLVYMLDSPILSHMARYAMGRIGGQEAGQALVQALKGPQGPIRAGYINTLVHINYRPAIPHIRKLMDDRFPSVVIAAVRALGHFAGDYSVQALREKREGAEADLQAEIDDALLQCAEEAVKRGEKESAEAIYESLYADAYPEHVQYAALRGLAITRGEGAVALLEKVATGDNVTLRRNAIGLLAMVKGAEAPQALMALASKATSDTCEVIVRTLAETGAPSAAPALIRMLDSEHENVSRAAIEALGAVGSPLGIPPLAKRAASGPEAAIARAALIRISGPEIPKALLDGARSGPVEQRVEIIKALGERAMEGAFDPLIEMARMDPVSDIRREAIQSLAWMSDVYQAHSLLALLVSPKESDDRPSIGRALVMIFNKSNNTRAKSEAVLLVYGKSPVEAQAIMLDLLNRAPTASAYYAVVQATESENETLVDAAIRSLGQWPNPEPAHYLLFLAREGDNNTHRVLALRGYIRMAGMMEHSAWAYQQALNVAERPDDIRAVLGGLGNDDSREALDMALEYAAKEDYANEGWRAVIQILEKYCWQDAAKARSLLEKIVAEGPNDGLRKDARSILNKMEQWKGNVYSWKASGPWQIPDVQDGGRVFQTVFPPEKSLTETSGKWRPLKARIEGNGRLDLQDTFGAIDNCCVYLATTVLSDQKQEAHIRLEADDHIKGWLNGQPISGNTVWLEKGANRLLLKVGDNGGEWNFLCRLTGPNDTPLEGVSFDRGM